jgi:hypothetical protein
VVNFGTVTADVGTARYCSTDGDASPPIIKVYAPNTLLASIRQKQSADITWLNNSARKVTSQDRRSTTTRPSLCKLTVKALSQLVKFSSSVVKALSIETAGPGNGSKEFQLVHPKVTFNLIPVWVGVVSSLFEKTLQRLCAMDSNVWLRCRPVF